MLAKGLPQDPMVFTMGHELKHHLTDSGSALSFCDACNQSDPIEIGAEIFAAELIYRDDDFRSDLDQMKIALGQCSPEVLVRLKHDTKTTLSYAGLASGQSSWALQRKGRSPTSSGRKLRKKSTASLCINGFFDGDEVVLRFSRPWGLGSAEKSSSYARHSMSLKDGGRDRDRTGDLLVANEALSQLSYSPISQRDKHILHQSLRTVPQGPWGRLASELLFAI
jgi:hypothetical protein